MPSRPPTISAPDGGRGVTRDEHPARHVVTVRRGITEGGTPVGLGGAGGVEYLPRRWFGAFLEAGARHFFTGEDVYAPDRVIVQLGVRLRAR